MNSIFTTCCIAVLAFAGPASAVVVFTDDFESPDVGGYNIANTSQTEDGAKWVDSNQGYNASRSGLVDQTYENTGWVDTDGNQAWAGRYSSNTGITSAEGVIGNLTSNTVITVSFNSMIDTQNSGSDINAYLVTYADGATTGRDDFRSLAAGTTSILAQFLGTATSTETGYQIVYTVGDDTVSGGTFDTGLLGDDIAIRFEHKNDALIDNVSIDISPVPEPSTFALLAGCFGFAWIMVRRRG